MGLFGGDSDNGSSALLDQSIRANQAELEAKKKNLFQTRLDIIKGQGKEVWYPPTLPQQSLTPPKSADAARRRRRMDFPFGGTGFLNQS